MPSFDSLKSNPSNPLIRETVSSLLAFEHVDSSRKNISQALIVRQNPFRRLSRQTSRRKLEKSVDKHLEKEHLYHDVNEHGIVYRLLNKMLHLIALVYRLYGVIKVDVKFIRRKKLVKFLSCIIISHNLYLSIKFGLIAFVGYLLNLELSVRNLSWEQLNCSLPDYSEVFMNTSVQVDDYLSNVMKNFGSMFTGFSPIPWNHLMATLYDNIGGPYKILGNRATLMYGFYALAIYIMLALFPIELMSLKVAFNYTKFVLNDINYIGDFLDNKQDYLEAIGKWSRVKSDSHITQCVNNTTGQRDLRCRYVTDINNDASNRQIVSASKRERKKLKIKGDIFRRLLLQYSTGDQRFKLTTRKYSILNVERYLMAPSKSLLHHMATNQKDEPDYNVKVASKNLMNFVPYVRSQNWLKYSMKLYPMFIFLTFTDVVIVIASISEYFETAFNDMNRDCARKTNSSINLCSNWNVWDNILYYETEYQVFALSCATSFYSSYYFGTILELNIWMQELSQQLDLCARVITISDDALKSHHNPDSQIGLSDWLQHRETVQHLLHDIDYLNNHAIKIDNLCNEFGGFQSMKSLYACKYWNLSVRSKISEIMALNLLDRKQTLLRATYLNMQLFLSEYKSTQFMTALILGRTARLSIGFAALASLTKSQLEASYMNLTFLLAISLAILNMYLIGAASINTTSNKLFSDIHRLVSAMLPAESDPDMLEFWLRYIQSLGLDHDPMSYKIDGYQINWGRILNFNGAVTSVYFYTIYHIV